MNRKESIINTYLELGCKKGFPNVSLGDIAAAEGITKASFFSHFKSFEELRLKTDEYCINFLQNKEIKVNFNASDSRGLLVNLVNSFIETFMEEPLYSWCILLDQLKLIDERYGTYSKQIDTMITARTTIALDFCVQRAWADIDDTDSLALLFTPYIRSLLISSDNSDEALDSVIKAFATLIR